MVNGSRLHPYETRLISELFDNGDLPSVASIQIEPRDGHAVRLVYTNGAVRMIHQSDLGLNRGSANLVARDKVASKHYLRLGGFCTPQGDGFLLDWWADELHADADEVPRVDRALQYINGCLGYPVYVKPHDGACGLCVWKCYDDGHVQEVLEQYERDRIKVALVEAAVSMPDYRIVVLDGQVISAYRRDPAQVVGDGVATLGQLRDRLAQECAARDAEHIDIGKYIPQISRLLARMGIDEQYVARAGEVVQLLDISNLCAGGTATDLTERIHPRWATLAAEVTGYFGLRLCGVDLACRDLTIGAGNYAIFEANGTPGLDLYGAVGEPQESIVRNLYAQVFNTMPID